MKPLRFLILISLLFALLGCGKDAQEKLDSAILSARISLTNGQCQEAIDTLEKAGRNVYSADYLTTLSSAYSCRAGFSQIVFFTTDVKKIQGANIFGSFSTFTTSKNVAPDADLKFSDNQIAIDLLLYAGGVSTPSHAGRSQHFSSRDLGNISSQGIFLVVAQLGKFVNYYANVNSSGLKGLGSGANSCYYTYTDVNALLAVGYLNTNTTNDTCDALGPVGHPDFNVATQTLPVVKTRMCRGVVLFNNFVDLFLGTTLSVSSELAELKSIEDDIENYISSCSVSGSGGTPLGPLCNVRSQSECETLSTIGNLEAYYAAIFESLTL